MAKKEAPKPGVPEWVLTYGDLMSLLLCFFILLAAFSELKKPREYQRVLISIQEAFGVKGGHGIIPENITLENAMITRQEAITKKDDGKSTEDPNPTPSQTGQQGQAQMPIEGVRQLIGTAIEFAPGSDVLTPEDEEHLRKDIAPRIKGLNFKIDITGHAGGPEDQAIVHDFTQLSFARAKAVAKFLINECGVRENRVRCVAVGDTEPPRAAPGGAGRTTSPRRVEVILTELTLEESNGSDPNGTGREFRTGGE